MLFNPIDNRGARIFDINFCNRFKISGLGFVGVRTPTLNEAGTNVANLGYMDRAISTISHDYAQFKDLWIYQAARYSMGHQRGPYRGCLWEDIHIEWSGNDGIDVKSNDSDGNLVIGINYNNTFRNIVGISWGNLIYTAPNVLVDARTQCHRKRCWHDSLIKALLSGFCRVPVDLKQLT